MSKSSSDRSLMSNHPALQELYERLPSFAQSDNNILIEGESGTGKEVVARLLHARSRRRENALVVIRCGALSEDLLEAELFGAPAGAPDGIAIKSKLELAGEGTLLLDEIGELPAPLQERLLDALERSGVRCRLLATTRRNLAALVREGRFREELYRRINTVHFRLFPLRERPQDIPMLAREILEKLAIERGWKGRTLSEDAVAWLFTLALPGNISELQNKLEGAVLRMMRESAEHNPEHNDERRALEPRDFRADAEGAPPAEAIAAPQEGGAIILDIRKAKERLELKLIEKALEQSGGNKSAAARLLGITREGLRKAMKKAA